MGLSGGLTFEMSGSMKGEKRPLGRQPDGVVRRHRSDLVECKVAPEMCASCAAAIMASNENRTRSISEVLLSGCEGREVRPRSW